MIEKALLKYTDTNGKLMVVNAYRVTNNLAIHRVRLRPEWAGNADQMAWTISHLWTGCAISHTDSIVTACRVARSLELRLNFSPRYLKYFQTDQFMSSLVIVLTDLENRGMIHDPLLAEQRKKWFKLALPRSIDMH